MADTWVTSEKANCTASGTKCSGSHRFFHPSKSTTFDKLPDVPWTMETIAKAKIQGVLHTDRINVAGFIVENQVLGTATVLDNVKENGIDGSFGLGLNAMTFNGDPTPIDNLIQSGTMRSEASLIIGVWMGSGNQGGELIFGGRDRSRYAGDMSYFDVPEGSVYWSIPVQALNVVIREPEKDQGGPTGKIKVKTYEVPSRIGSGTGLSVPNVIFDTSSNVILVPPRVALTVHQKIHNFLFGWYSGYSIFAGAYTVSCSLVNEPSFDIWIEFGRTATKAYATQEGGVSAAFVVKKPFGDSEPFGNSSTTTADTSTTPKDKPADGQSPLQLPSPPPGSQPSSTSPTPAPDEPEPSSTNRRFRISGKDLVREPVPILGSIFNTCYSGIQPSKTDDDDWVFGNIWFTNNYMTLDHLNRQIGIAASLHQED
ncbi:hypothetical protein BG000_009563 [Podila horticola]|nr:hypothetical protein BG000_009563 [Podila horticola]